MDEMQKQMHEMMDKLTAHEASIDKLWEHSKRKSHMYEIPEITNVFKPAGGATGGYGMDGFGGLGGGGIVAGLLLGALFGRNGGFGGVFIFYQ